MTHLCLNMIVRNESARITRALDSVRPYISTIVVLDTGSTDGTPEMIEQWGHDHGITTYVFRGEFVNFEQARNEALDYARMLPVDDFLLLMDADMVLRVSDPHVFDRLDKRAPAYEIIQRNSAISYSNVRLLNIKSQARYVGVTHEYLSTDSAGVLSGVWFDDFADGANRGEKAERDIRLLTADLERDPNNERTWFYLANTYSDVGKLAEAENAYRRRVALGGWDEEVWNAQFNLAMVNKRQGLNAAFVHEMLKAYQFRPQRAESLYELAKHYREAGDNNTATLFAEAGLRIKRPDDRLFVVDSVYAWGLREELAIAGFYNERTRPAAFAANNSLALDPTVPETTRWRARRDMVWYLPKLSQVAPSAKFTEIDFTPDPGYTAMNPCVTNRPSGEIEVLLRTVNYRINEHGQYMIGEKGCQDAPIDTRNWLLYLAPDLSVQRARPVVWDRPPAKFPLVIGLEDVRIFWRGGSRHFFANVREQREDGQCVQWHGLLNGGTDDVYADSAHPISDGTQTEKNWAPWIAGLNSSKFVYRLDVMGRIEDERGVLLPKVPRAVAVENISGSSQWIAYGGGMLSVVHEAVAHPAHGRRVYQHRFAWTDMDFNHLILSKPFCFRDVQIEFCAGIARRGKTLIFSFGERDEKAWLVAVDGEEVMTWLHG